MVLLRYMERLERLRRDGTVRFAGRAPNGDHSLMLVEAQNEAQANTIARSDPAVSEGLMRVEQHVFLVVLDGAKALRRAVLDVFDRPVIGRCQLHKIRNVEDRLPDKLCAVVAARMRRAYHAESALAAEAELTALAAELDRTHPGAAASLREAWPRR